MTDRRFRILFLLLLILSHPRVQTRLITSQAKRVLREFEYYLKTGTRITLATLERRRDVEDREKLEEEIKKYAETFVISPVTLDPVGIIKRLEHLMDTHEEYMRLKARKLIGNDNPLAVDTLATLLVAVNALLSLYKILRHLIISASKSGSILIAYQIQVLLPRLRSLMIAYYDALKAFSVLSTIGDSAGPYVARLLGRKLNAEFKPVEIDEHACIAEGERKGRKVFIVKARGPAPNLCNFGRVVHRLGKNLGDSLGAIITVDAALKLEGEETGDVQVGIGAAIGDPGHEKYRMESIAAELDVPLMAVIIKQGLAEAIVPMAKNIAEGCKKASEEVLELIEEIVPEGKSVIVVGVGNTSGVSQGITEDFNLPPAKRKVTLNPDMERVYKIRTYLRSEDGTLRIRPFRPGDYVGKLVEEEGSKRIIEEVSAEIPKEISEVGMPLLLGQ